jgi:hypothetical protein
VVKYNGNIILTGSKDRKTDLWTLPLGTPRTTANHSNKAMTMLAAPDCTNTHAQSPTKNAFFMHTVQNKANSIWFAHQSLCSPKISTLLKAICCGYLKGCPNLTATSITKYLNPSLATAKGHMTCLWMEIRITQRKDALEPVAAPTPTNPALYNNQSTNDLLSDPFTQLMPE